MKLDKTQRRRRRKLTDDPPADWTFSMHMAFTDCHVMTYERGHHGLRLQMNIFTPTGKGKREVSFGVHGREDEYDTEAELMASLPRVCMAESQEPDRG